MLESARRPFAHHEMSFDAGAVQHLKQAHAEDRARRARDADNEARSFCVIHSQKPFKS